MKVLLDTNVIVDFALEREPFWQASEAIFQRVEHNQLSGYVSASTISDLYYIIRKERGRNWALEFLRRLVSLCQVATVDQSIIAAALAANLSDFEDAIQYHTALVHQLDAIATRNPQDFPVGSLQILTPDTLLQLLA